MLKTPGRIESYIHSDSQTANKGAAMILVTCETDFAARTPEFIAFVKIIAIRAYAVSGNAKAINGIAKPTWKNIIEEYPDLAVVKKNLEKKIKEKVELKHALVLSLDPQWTKKEPKGFDYNKVYTEKDCEVYPGDIDGIKCSECGAQNSNECAC